jgi:predicted MFS family arabinose efflux permease
VVDRNTAAAGPAPGGLSVWSVFALATGAGTAIATNYVLQPLLPQVARSVAASPVSGGLIAGGASFGYTLGLAFLAPLGDRVDPKRLFILQAIGLAAALALAAFAANATLLIACLVGAGAMATATVQCSALGARMAPPERTGRIMGVIGVGVSLGILLGRTVGGALGQALGWRAMMLILATVILMMAAAMGRMVPPSPTHGRAPSYGEILKSMPGMLRAHPALRESALVGACMFAAFSVFWSSLAIHVAGPPFGYGPAVAGLFGLVGVVGAVGARWGGRLADRIGARASIARGFVSATLAFFGLWVFGGSVPGLAAGVVLLDFGSFAAQAANQTRVLTIDIQARSRVYSLYMVLYYAAGATGSFLGPVLIARFGWPGVCALGLGLTATGILVCRRR